MSSVLNMCEVHYVLQLRSLIIIKPAELYDYVADNIQSYNFIRICYD